MSKTAHQDLLQDFGSLTCPDGQFHDTEADDGSGEGDRYFLADGTAVPRNSLPSGEHRIAVRTCMHCGCEIYTVNVSWPSRIDWESWQTFDSRYSGWKTFDGSTFQFTIREEEELFT